MVEADNYSVLIELAPAGPGVVRFVRPEGNGGARVLAEIGGRMIEGFSTTDAARGDACRVQLLAGTVFQAGGGSRRWRR